MRLNTSHVPVETQNIGKTHSAKIIASGAMFDLLSTKLYTDPITAMIREPLKNALDAHIDAGQTRPIKVTLPSRSDPVLIIQDFGKGLTSEQVINNFLNYGASTKSDSDVLHGGFGIGSKAPYAYQDQFTVASHHAGVKETYIFFRNPGEGPRLAETPLTEPSDITGLEIIIPVAQNDFWVVEDKLNKLASFFPAGCMEIDGIPNESYDVEFENDYGYIISSSFEPMQVHIGPVAYGVNFGRASKTQGLVLKCPIDRVTIAPSRESLISDEKTIETVTEVFEAFMADPDLQPHMKSLFGFSRYSDRELVQQQYRFNFTPEMQAYVDNIKANLQKVEDFIPFLITSINKINSCKSQSVLTNQLSGHEFLWDDDIIVLDDLEEKQKKSYWARLKDLSFAQTSSRRVIVVKEHPNPTYWLSSTQIPSDLPRLKIARNLERPAKFHIWKYRGNVKYSHNKDWFPADANHHINPTKTIIIDHWPVTAADNQIINALDLDRHDIIVTKRAYASFRTLNDKLEEYLDTINKSEFSKIQAYNSLTYDERIFNDHLITLGHKEALSTPPTNSNYRLFLEYRPQEIPSFDLGPFRSAMKANPILVEFVTKGLTKKVLKCLLTK